MITYNGTTRTRFISDDRDEKVCGGNIIKSNIALMQCRIFKIDTGLKTKLEWWRSVNMPWKWQPYSILGHLPRYIITSIILKHFII